MINTANNLDDSDKLDQDNDQDDEMVANDVAPESKRAR